MAFGPHGVRWHAYEEQNGLINHRSHAQTSGAINRRPAIVPSIVLQRASTIGDDGDEAGRLLKLNIGGCSFRLDVDSVVRHCHTGYLQRLALDSHDERLADGRVKGFIEATGEYFFQRSFVLFEPVYRFCCSGALHCPLPLNVCADEFVAELHFWGVPRAELNKCATCALRFGDGCADERDEAASDLNTAKIEFDAVACCPSARHAIWRMLEGQPHRWHEKLYTLLSIGFILTSTVTLVLASLEGFQASNQTQCGNETISNVTPLPVLDYLEIVCVGFFTVEVVAKLLVAPHRLQALMDVMTLVDIISVFPFYVERTVDLLNGPCAHLFGNMTQAFLVVRILRILRILRIFKLGRYSSGLRTFALTLKASYRQLSMMGFVFSIAVIFFSTIIYFFEREMADSKFNSIPAGFWWAVVTMTTVGYGDVVPTSVGGKLVGSCAIACGVLVLALPITIIVDNFMRIADQEAEYERVRGGDDADDDGQKLYGRHAYRSARVRRQSSVNPSLRSYSR